jgi:hypothetical protein
MKNLLWILPVLLASSASANLIVDGNFASPASPSTFASGYSNISCGGGTEPGQYAIASNPNTCNSGFASFGDPASDGGNMMVLDGNTSTTTFDGLTGPLAGVVWEETITVAASTLYTFTAEVASNDTSNLASLALYVNGTQVGSDFGAPGTAGVWSLWTQAFTAPSSSVTLSIQDVNTNPLAYGDDFSLDTLTINVPTSGAPEPTTLLLAGAGLAALMARRFTSRRSRREQRGIRRQPSTSAVSAH